MHIINMFEHALEQLLWKSQFKPAEVRHCCVSHPLGSPSWMCLVFFSMLIGSYSSLSRLSSRSIMLGVIYRSPHPTTSTERETQGDESEHIYTISGNKGQCVLQTLRLGSDNGAFLHLQPGLPLCVCLPSSSLCWESQSRAWCKHQWARLGWHPPPSPLNHSHYLSTEVQGGSLFSHRGRKKKKLLFSSCTMDALCPLKESRRSQWAFLRVSCSNSGPVNNKKSALFCFFFVLFFRERSFLRTHTHVRIHFPAPPASMTSRDAATLQK